MQGVHTPLRSLNTTLIHTYIRNFPNQILERTMDDFHRRLSKYQFIDDGRHFQNVTMTTQFTTQYQFRCI